MDARDKWIDELIGEAIDECLSISSKAVESNNTALSEHLNEAIAFFEKRRKAVLAGQLVRPSHGEGLGFSAAIGGWAYKFERLMGIMYEIDRYYAETCNCPRAGS